MTQDDVLFPQLSVEETLVFAAFLRLPSSMSTKQKYQRVEMIIKELGLERSFEPFLIKILSLSCFKLILWFANLIFPETDAVTQELEEGLSEEYLVEKENEPA